MNRRIKIAGFLGAALVAGAIGTGVATAGGNHATHASSNGPAAEKDSATAHTHTANHKGWGTFLFEPSVVVSSVPYRL